MTVPDDATFRLLVVPGVIVDRWSRTWSERLPDVALRVVPVEQRDAATLLAAGADAGLLRLPVDQDRFHAITLYTEVTVVVFPRDHILAAVDEADGVTLADLAGETLLRPLDEVLDWAGTPAYLAAVGDDRPATTSMAVELVAAGAGLLVVPLSLARAHHRRDVAHRVLTDAPTSSVALVWPRERYTDMVEEMIGIVRGRTVNSTRGRVEAPTAARTSRPTPAPKRTGTRPAGKRPRTPPRRGR